MAQTQLEDAEENLQANAGSSTLAQKRRPVCSQCQRALRACICACARRVECETEVLILQHPAEVHHVKGSARLLHLCLPQSTIAVGEVFDANTLRQRLHTDGKTNVLLYPDSTVASLPAASSYQPGSDTAIRLVLIDASWRHSKQMLLQNPLLQEMPRYALSEVPTSRYQIRHAHAEDQLSTLEACTYALMQVEPHNPQVADLLLAFDAFNALQIEFGVNNLLRVKK
ncbi:tRNA-uridine aminocarboxypropyltransferase [Undibacterium flavidum]|uniref:tRNA-uridine aminocarboxypropyltransferase n=1 Tax=Undibacterium flavidum TaxID=2762297 RepID=A0ABR6YF18_9BURK|nr:tRNA-uridine aminocarboxypropyltransferase [Undibacterium flavidum]MBC3875102.1 DTW domain-containing protein [Undibacterium flavidum]